MSREKRFQYRIQWKDLRVLSCGQVIYNVMLPYPFLLTSLWLAGQSYYVLAMGFSALFFAANFRQSHDGFHGTLGVSKPLADWLLVFPSLLLLSSNHVSCNTHLAHHRSPLTADDIEAKFHQLTWHQSIVRGPLFFIEQQIHGYRIGNRQSQCKILLEWTLMLTVIVVAISTMSSMLIYHVLVMFVGNSLVGFVAGWCVHHDCDETVIARTERNKVLNLLTFNLLYHQEHHLFPTVPSNNLPKLAVRLDKSAPDLVSKRVLLTSVVRRNDEPCLSKAKSIFVPKG